MCKRLGKIIISIFVSAWNVLLKDWYHFLGGGIMVLISIYVTDTYHLRNKAVIDFFAFICGVYVAENIYGMCWFRKVMPIALSLRNQMKLASRKGKFIYLFEHKMVLQYHDDIKCKFNNLLSRGIDMSFSEYERLLRIFIEVALEIKAKEICLEGTCMILPNKFKRSDNYPQIWDRFYREYSKLNPKLLRILCDHKKDTLLKAVESDQKKFENFCDWNKDTGFELYIFGGNYEEIRRDANLSVNDFGIFNKTILIGGDITELEKKKTTELAKMIIKKSSITYDIHRYDELLAKLKDNNGCKKINLEGTRRYEEVMEFLNSI